MTEHYFIAIEPELISSKNKQMSVSFVENNIDNIVSWYEDSLIAQRYGDDYDTYDEYIIDDIISIKKIGKKSILIEFTKTIDEDGSRDDQLDNSSKMVSNPNPDCPLTINEKNYEVYAKKITFL